jgi:hypothetical protein
MTVRQPSRVLKFCSPATTTGGYGRPTPSLDVHRPMRLSKRVSDMSDAELAALEARMLEISATLALQM